MTWTLQGNGTYVNEAGEVSTPNATSGMPAPKNGALNEIGTGIKRGAVVELPKMLGMGMKATGRPGDTLYDAGQGMVDSAEERGKAPQNQLNADDHGWFVNALASGGEMLAPSAVGMAAAVPLALAGAPAAALAAGAVATGGLFGASQFQETYEHVKGAGGDDKSAFKAGLLSGAIEAGGEGLAAYIGGKFVTRAGSAIVGKTLDSGLKGMAAPGILKPFASGYAKTLGVEVGTEMGQNTGESAVEQAYGVKEANPWESAKAAIAPTFGLTTLLAPFGLHANIKQARQIKNDVATITDGDVNDYQGRSDAVNRLGTLLDNSPPPGMTGKEWATQVNDWRMTALEAANSGQPIDADTLLSGALSGKAGQFVAAKQFEDKAEQDAVVTRDPEAQVYDDFGNPVAAPLPVTKGAAAVFGNDNTPGTVVDVTDTSITIKEMDGSLTTLTTPEAMASVKVVPPEAAAAAATEAAHASGLNVGDPVKLGGAAGTVVEQDSKFAGKGSVSVRMADGSIRHIPAAQVHTKLSSDSPKVQGNMKAAFEATPTGAAAKKDADKKAADEEKAKAKEVAKKPAPAPKKSAPTPVAADGWADVDPMGGSAAGTPAPAPATAPFADEKDETLEIPGEPGSATAAPAVKPTDTKGENHGQEKATEEVLDSSTQGISNGLAKAHESLKAAGVKNIHPNATNAVDKILSQQDADKPLPALKAAVDALAKEYEDKGQFQARVNVLKAYSAQLGQQIKEKENGKSSNVGEGSESKPTPNEGRPGVAPAVKGDDAPNAKTVPEVKTDPTPKVEDKPVREKTKVNPTPQAQAAMSLVGQLAPSVAPAPVTKQAEAKAKAQAKAEKTARENKKVTAKADEATAAHVAKVKAETPQQTWDRIREERPVGKSYFPSWDEMKQWVKQARTDIAKIEQRARAFAAERATLKEKEALARQANKEVTKAGEAYIAAKSALDAARVNNRKAKEAGKPATFETTQLIKAEASAKAAKAAADNKADDAAQVLIKLNKEIAEIDRALSFAEDANKVADRLDVLADEFPKLRLDPGIGYDYLLKRIADSRLTPILEQYSKIRADITRSDRDAADRSAAKEDFLDLVDRIDRRETLTSAQEKEMRALYKEIRKGNVTGEPSVPDMLRYAHEHALDFAGVRHTNTTIQAALVAASGTNDMASVMDAVIQTALGERMKPLRTLAVAFKGMVGGIKVAYQDVVMPGAVRKNGEASQKHGNFNTIRNEATYYRGGENAHVVLHEAAHGLTVAELRKAEGERNAGGKPKNQEAARRAVALRNLETLRGFLEGMPQLAGEYAFKNNAEFIAEVWSNTKFQAKLKDIELPAGMLEQMPERQASAFDGFVSIIKSMLGLADKHTSALAQALDITGEFFGPNTEVTAPRIIRDARQRKGMQGYDSRSEQTVDRAQLLQRVEDAIKQIGDRAEQSTGHRWKTLPDDKAALASLNKTRTSIVTAQTKALNAEADASYAGIKGGPSLAETLDALVQATGDALAVVRADVMRPTLATSFDSLSTPSAAFAETTKGVGEVISNAKSTISKAIGRWDTVPKLRQLGLYLSTTKNMESNVNTSKDLHPLQPAFDLWFKADELKTRVIGHLNEFLYANHLSTVQVALSKMKDSRKINADMGHAANEISLISEEIGYAIDPRKDFAGNKAAHPTLDPVLRDRVNELKRTYMGLSPEVQKLIERGFMATRKAHIEFSASRLLSALQNTQHSPSSAASAAETMVNKYGKLLDVLAPASGTTITDPKLFMDAKSSELDKHMRDAFDDIHRAFGGEDLQEAFDAMAKEYKRSVASPYQFQNRPGNYFVSFDVANTTPANIGNINKALEPFGVKIGGFPGGSKHVYMKMQSQVEMNATVQALTKLGAAIEGKVEAGKTSDAGRMATAFGAASAVNKLRESLIARYEELRQTGSMTQDMKVAKEQAIAFINSSFIDLIEGDSARTTMTKRKGIPGADTDYQKTFAKRGEFYVSLISNQYAQPHFDKSFRDMKAEIAELQKDNHDAGVRGQEVMDELTTRTNNAMNPVDAPIVRTITAFGYHFFLSLSPAFALVNLLQPSHLTLPLIGGRYGFVKSSMGIMNASAMAFKIIKKSWGKAWAEGGFFAAAEAKLDLEGLGLTPGQVAMVQHMIEGGTLSSSMTHELGRMAEGDDRRLANAAKAMGVMTHYSEVMNRLTAGLAAYNMATENKYIRGDKTDMSKDEDAKIKYAIGVVNQTQFLYSDHNTARAIGRHGIAGKLTPMLASFQNYAFQMMEHYIRLVDQGWINKSDQLSDVERKEARKALYGTLGMTSIIAGTMGLPFANVVAAAANGLAGDDDKEDIRNQYRNFLETVFGKDVAEVVAHGAVRAAGIDIAASSGHQDLLPGTRFLADRRKFEDKVKDGSLALMGPGLNAALDVVGGLSHIAEGDIRQGVETALPRALKGYFKAGALVDQGAFTDKAGNKLPIPVDDWNILQQSLGFTPAKKAEHSEANFYYQAEQNLTKQAKAKMVNDAVKAYENGDMEGFAQQRLVIQEYNMRNPMNQITDLSASLAGRARGRAYAAMQPAAIIDRNAKHLPQISQYSWANTRSQP